MASKLHEDNWRRVVGKAGDIITFEVDDKEVLVPKLVLIAHSKYFETKFNSEMADANDDHIKITDYSYDVIEKMVALMFSPQSVISSSKMALDLCKAADYYQIAHVKFAAGKYLLDHPTGLTPSIVLNVFVEAELQGSKELMMQTLSYILKENIDVTELANYDKLSHSQTTILMKAYSAANDMLNSLKRQKLYRKERTNCSCDDPSPFVKSLKPSKTIHCSDCGKKYPWYSEVDNSWKLRQDHVFK